MIGRTRAPDRVWSIVLAGSNRHVPLLLVCVVLAAACTKPTVHQAIPTDSLPPLMACRAGDCHVLAGEWEYIDALAVRLILDEQGNGYYNWMDGRFETHSLIGHTWQGMWFQKENDREGGFTVEFSPDFSEGEGRWWVSRIGANQTSAQKEGTFRLSKKIALMDHRDTPPAP